LTLAVATQPPDIFVLDLDAQLSGADKIEYGISALLEGPNSKASVTLRFLSAPLLSRKFLHGWHVIALLDPFNQGKGETIGR
jgi:hypothetical protein